ncbi:YlmC/YmxH family sporulation protein [Candidatus Contubernalis alkaliaceticus]|uniref:YlmC/YmxH family sporulation protein n=1 Tax=Candidatus Contubernalis alkaliaceticus TaxID=338645 RepID=UPI001F4C1203|nr:YlmC/YmxH family sporulation protein [Candidatus Contubernalis alkalaceticus]UNC92864.1 YlmC/YmxH family sporulation protein [Candidatus Contubernalis alkalaceticus]
MLKTSDLKTREVINIQDGRRLGMVSDLDIDLEHGKIRAIIIPGSGKLLGFFGGDRDYVIPWSKIVKIGIDTILVELPDYSYDREDYYR